LITDALAKHDDVLEAARAYEEDSAEQVVPWYHFSVLTDQMRAAASGGDLVAAAGGNGDGFGALFSGMLKDPELVHLMLRVLNLLELPTALLARLPELQAAAPAEGWRPRDDTVKRPSREELLSVVA
jgi:hypothetical protein